MNGELLDSGYQMVCTSQLLVKPDEITAWLADQLQWMPNPTEQITSIDAFQIVPAHGGWFVVAVCRICKQD